MKESQKARLVQAWIAGQKAGTGSAAEEKHWWAVARMMDIPHEEPELGWELIQRIHRSTNSAEVRSILAAGPLEDLMKKHGRDYISRVEALARRNQRFRWLMRGVWLSARDTPVWRQFYRAAGVSQPRHLKKFNRKRKNGG